VNKPTNLEDVNGSLAHGYKTTLVTLDNLLQALNTLEAAGKLPDDGKLTDALLASMVAMRLGQLHFPALELWTEIQKRAAEGDEDELGDDK
jgi:hypothetical protein